MNQFKTYILMALLSALLVWIGNLVGGRDGALLALVFAGVMNFSVYWFSDRIILRMYRAKEATEAEEPGLHRIVRELALRGGLPMPKVYIIPNDAPNAFATGRNPQHAAVAVTTGIKSLLTEEELKGVLAHELSHIRHRDILIGTIVATIAGAISMIATMARFGAMFGGFGGDNRQGGGIAQLVAVLVLTTLASIAAVLIQLAISRSREYHADEGGAQLAGQPPLSRQGLGQAGCRGEADPHAGQSLHRPHAHRQSPAGKGDPEPLQHPPTHRGTHQEIGGDD